MTARDFARLLIKLMGLFVLAMILVHLIYTATYLPFNYRDYGLSATIALGVIPILFALLIGWTLFRSDRLIADTMLFTKDKSGSSEMLDFRKVEEILLALLGVYFVAHGLISLAGAMGSAMGAGEFDVFLTNAIPGFAHILIGAFVFLSSRGLVVLRHKFVEFRTKVRNMGATE